MGAYEDWANRQVGRGGSAPATARTPAQHAAPPPPPALPAPPPGFGYVPNAQYGWVLVPISYAPPAAPVMAGPPAYPGAGYTAPVPPTRAPARVIPIRTNTLVKDSARDLYAEVLAGVPDLVPPGAYDAMTGNPSPETLAAMAGMAEFSSSMSMSPPDAFTSVGHRPAKVTAPLGGK